LETIIENKFRTKKVSLIAFSHFVHDIYTAFLSPILPIIINRFSLSYSFAGFLILLHRIPALFSPLLSSHSKNLNPYLILIITPLISSLGMSFLLNIESIWIIIFLLLLTGISSAFYHIPSPVIIKYYSGNRTGAGMSFYMFAGELARSIGPLVILSAISWWGEKNAYNVVLLGIIASLLIFIQFFKDGKFKINNEIDNTKVKDVILRQKKVFTIAFALVLTKTFMVIAMTSFLPIFLTQKGESLWLAGASLSIIEIFGAVGTMISGSLSDLIGRKKILMILTIISPILMILFIFAKGIIIYPLLILLGFVVFSFSPIILAYVIENEKDSPMIANSILMSINFGTGSLIALILGFLSDLFSLETSYIISAILSLIGIPFILKISDKK